MQKSLALALLLAITRNYAAEISKNPPYLTSFEEVATRAICQPSFDVGMRVLRYTNQFRANHGRRAISWNRPIALMARRHSIRMANGIVPFGHDGFNCRVQNYPCIPSSAGENVARGTGDGDIARIAVNLWKNSPGHRANLLGNYNFMGVGVARKGGAWYITQDFALF